MSAEQQIRDPDPDCRDHGEGNARSDERADLRMEASAPGREAALLAYEVGLADGLGAVVAGHEVHAPMIMPAGAGR